MFQNYPDQKEDRDKEVAKAEEDKSTKKALKVVIQEEPKVVERKVMQHKDFEQNKKPRTEEPDIKKDTSN
eukprot:12829360-Heterocapsa_arctica.AAC.1